MSPHHPDIERMVEAYFTGLYQADADLLATVFHPDARYTDLTPGHYRSLTLNDYLLEIEGRIAPAARGEARNGSIRSISVAGECMAFVIADLTMMQRRYTDYLTLVNDGGWRIISKTFIWHPIKGE